MRTRSRGFYGAAWLACCWPGAVDAAQAAQDQPPPGAVKTIQDALEQLERDGRGKSAPARPLGNVADYFGPDAYPAAALRGLEQGRVVARVDIDQRGYPTGCTVVTPSGSASLDQETCQIAQMKMQFAPARDRRGKSMASQYTLSVRWSLPEDAPEIDVTAGRKVMVDMTVEVAMDVEGMVASCKVVHQEPAALNPCSRYPVGSSMNVQPVRNGGPSPARMTIVNRVYVDQP